MTNIEQQIIDALSEMDCLSSCCKFAKDKSGQRVNGGCTCIRGISTKLRISLEKLWFSRDKI